MGVSGEEFVAHVGCAVVGLRLPPQGGNGATSDVFSVQADTTDYPETLPTVRTAFPPVTLHEPCEQTARHPLTPCQAPARRDCPFITQPTPPAA